jgi:ligand-binding SRPBCC domain-containing protein
LSRHILRRRQFIPLPASVVFPFFERAENLESITPPWLGFRVLEAPAAPLAAGSVVRYRLRLLGLPLRWDTRIERLCRGWGFVDRQTRGPYSSWIHIHLFSPTPGGVVMEDRVDYRLPLFPLGELAAPVVRLQLVAIFRYRRRKVEALVRLGFPGAR